MKITSKGMAKVSGVTLKAGTRNYAAIDYKDPLTALQLDALKEVGLISFNELVDPKPAAQALDDPKQTLKIDYVKKRDEHKRVTEYAYKGSEIVKPVKAKEKSSVGKPDKTVGKAGRDGNSNKS